MNKWIALTLSFLAGVAVTYSWLVDDALAGYVMAAVLVPLAILWMWEG